MMTFLANIPYWYMGWILSGIILLAVTTIFNLGNGIGYDFVHILSFVGILFWFKRFRGSFDIDLQKLGWILILLFVFLFPTLIRFPLYFPLYDDLSFHIPAGAYAGSYWFDKNYMAMSFLNYLYPLPQLAYYPLINWLGMRLTLLITGGAMAIWFFSLVLRFIDLKIFNGIKKYILLAIFIYIFFYPYLLTTQVSFSVDFIALLFALEAFYQFISIKVKDKTLSLVLFLTSFFVKESTGIFLLPLAIFVFFSVWKKKINWKLLAILLGLISVYFIRCFYETGNPLGFLYNGIFKSPIYTLSNFRDHLFGPLNAKEMLLWPFIGPFTERFGQGWVPQYLRIFFALFLPLPLIISLVTSFIKRRWTLFIIPITYYLWVCMSGYSRYLIPFTSIFWIWVMMEIKIPNFSVKNFYVKISLITISIIFLLFSLTSIQTDYGWRPYPFARVYGQLSGSVRYYLKTYISGIFLIGKDRSKNMAKKYKNDFKGFDVIVPFWRGQVAFYAYLGYLNGLKVIDAVDSETFNKVTNSHLLSNHLKENLKQINTAKKILFIFEKNNEQYAKNTYIYKNFSCQKLNNAPVAPEFQSDYYFNQIERMSCTKR